jgi:quinol monooxygenase YgiN
MFTRIVECNVKPGKSEEFTRKIDQEIIPILKDQPGFVDESILVSTTNREQIFSISTWRSREDAERYNREHYPRIVSRVEPLLTGPPEVQTFEVRSSVTHKIASGKAA